MTTIFRAAGAADFLALVPRLLGYRARRSVVLVPFEDARSLGAMRLDLPGELDADERESFSATALGLVCKVGSADGLAVVVYTDAQVADGEGLPSRALVSALLAHANRCGLRVSEALCVAADAWGSYLDPECPAAGRPLSDIPYDHEAFAGDPLPNEDQESGAALPEVGSAERERLRRSLAEIDGAMASLFGRVAPPGAGGEDDADADAADARRIAPGALVTVCRMDDLPLLFEEALTRGPAELDPYEAGALAWCLSRPALRDVALVQWASDLSTGDEAFEAQLRYSDGEPYPEHLAARIWGDASAPDPQRLQSALALTRRLAAAAPRSACPGILAAAAWLAWALGRSTHAGRYAELAREIDPSHVLAGIVLGFVANAHLPEWVYRRRAPCGPVTRSIDSRLLES